MRRLVVATQKYDTRDSILAATVPKVRALAARVDEVVVLCDAAEPGIAPPNVRVHEFGGRSQVERGARFATALARELRPRPDAFLAHMIPLYVAIAAPLLKPLRVPIGLWYSHPVAHPLLRVATATADVVMSVNASTFPFDSRKLVALGHGIDVEEFTCADAREPHEGLDALVLGRYATIKGIDRIVRAAALARERGVEVSIVGYGSTPDGHRSELERLAAELGVRASFRDAVPRSELPSLLAAADVLVNATKGPSADKVVFEAAASCVPVLASSEAFADLLPPELRFDRERPETLADRLVTFDRSRRPELRGRVVRDHSVEHWADGVVATLSNR
jgi:glycosyltransferase involved in cell wall biosynthesis